MNVIDEVKQASAYALSGFADSAGPDTNESAGARFLVSIRDAVIESVEYLMGSDALTLTEAVEDMRYHGKDGEIADGAVPVYTHEKWATFVDLAAYNEDLTELGDFPDDMDSVSGWALYLMASRLVSVILDELEQGDVDED
ncbi:OCR-like antirestriction protein [Streptomyces phage Itza]|nr:OCR-like antirestriction protein [Streptomyces phage Itza]